MNEEDRSANQPPNSNMQSSGGFKETIEFMKANKVDVFQWLTRLGTIVFTFLSLVPVFGVSPYTCYQRALLSNAATSALRLHQRMPHVQFTRQFGSLVLIEDSFHYLLYSILFIYSYPITLSLLPIFLFAVLHSARYSGNIVNKLGFDTTRPFTLVIENQRNILRFVSLTEVSLMPITVFLTYSGKGSLLTPFAYYRFLTLRYASLRNPYTRTVFHEMRIIIENFANTTGRNLGLSNLCFKLINFVSWLAPPVATQQ